MVRPVSDDLLGEEKRADKFYCVSLHRAARGVNNETQASLMKTFFFSTGERVTIYL